MKVTKTCVILCAALACLVCGGSAQQNWWERGPDGSPTISSSRTTSRPTNGGSSSTQTPAMMPTNCPCATTPEYNPVCGDLGGTNRLTYSNPGMLACAQNCGQNVRLLFHGRCEKVA